MFAFVTNISIISGLINETEIPEVFVHLGLDLSALLVWRTHYVHRCALSNSDLLSPTKSPCPCRAIHHVWFASVGSVVVVVLHQNPHFQIYIRVFFDPKPL